MSRRIDAEKFVRLWLDGATYSEIATACGCHSTYVGQFAVHLRKRGVELPKRNGNGAIDVAALNKLIKESKS